MIRKITLLLLLCISVVNATYAQQACGFDQAHQQLLNQNTAYAQNVNTFNAQVAQWLNNNPNINSLVTTNAAGDTIFEIPVVVHVMHTGGAIGSVYNISDARIDTTIDYVNETFNATWPSYPNTSNGGTRFRRCWYWGMKAM